MGEEEHGEPDGQHPPGEPGPVAGGHPRPGGRGNERGNPGSGEHAARGQAEQGAGGGLVPGGGQDDGQVEAGARDGRAERSGGREDPQVPQVRVGVEAGDADLGDERDDLGQEGATEQGEHLAQHARAGRSGRCSRHVFI